MNLHKGKYYMGTMDTNTAETILSILDLDRVQHLTHCIYDVPEHTISDLIQDVDTYEESNGNLKGYKTDLLKSLPLGTLTDKQTVGTAFMYYARSCILGDGVGLGKTVQVAGLANILFRECMKRGEDFKFLFLTEKANVGQIRDKLIRFTGKYVGMLESGEKAVIAKYIEKNEDRRYYSVVGSHSLITCSEFLVDCKRRPFDLIIVDESSILRNSANDMYKNAKALASLTERFVELNATPLENDLMEFYNQLAILDKGYLPTKTDFKREFFTWTKTAFGVKPSGFKNADFFSEAVKLRYIARTRSDQGAVYEGNTLKSILIPLSEAQKRLMKKTSLYRMVSDYPPAVDKTVEYSLENVPKIAALLYLLDMLDIKQDKALIYCNFKECQYKIQSILIEKGYKCEVLNGETKAKDKYTMVRNFNEGVFDILITNVQKGLDLNSCNNCILYTIDPNPQKMVQFEGRITRELDIIGKSVYLLIAMGKEKKFVEDKLQLKINAGDAFMNSGHSMVTDAISESGNKEMFSYDIMKMKNLINSVVNN